MSDDRMSDVRRMRVVLQQFAEAAVNLERAREAMAKRESELLDAQAAVMEWGEQYQQAWVAAMAEVERERDQVVALRRAKEEAK